MSSSFCALGDQRLRLFRVQLRRVLWQEHRRTSSLHFLIFSEAITSTKQIGHTTNISHTSFRTKFTMLTLAPPVALTYRYVVASLFSRSLACATATLMHCSHSSACFSSSAFSTYVLSSVKISKARGRLRSRRFFATTFTLWILLSSMVLSSGSSFWLREHRKQTGLNNTV